MRAFHARVLSLASYIIVVTVVTRHAILAKNARQASVKCQFKLFHAILIALEFLMYVHFLWNSFQACGIHATKHCEHWLSLSNVRN